MIAERPARGQNLLVLQSLWTMDQPPLGDLSLEAKIERIAEAGYDGIAIDCDDPAYVRRSSLAARSLGLVIEGQCTPSTEAGLRSSLELAAKHGVHHLAVQPAIVVPTPEQGADILLHWLAVAAQFKVKTLIETHRGRLTNDLGFTLSLLDRLPELMLLADLSHYVVAHEMEWPIAAEKEAMIYRLLGRAAGFHGRVASSEQVQIEISFPQNHKWRDLFLRWWEYGFRSWRQRSAKDATLTFTCELGPRPYSITDRNNQDTTDRWHEASLMARLVRECWKRVATSDHTPPSELA